MIPLRLTIPVISFRCRDMSRGVFRVAVKLRLVGLLSYGNVKGGYHVSVLRHGVSDFPKGIQGGGRAADKIGDFLVRVASGLLIRSVNGRSLRCGHRLIRVGCVVDLFKVELLRSGLMWVFHVINMLVYQLSQLITYHL